MKIIKKGTDESQVMQCPKCGCVFLYLPGEVEDDPHEIYNVPEQHRRCYGGKYDPVEIQIHKIVRCPSCKTKCDI